jgi:hypothetical protein
VALWSPRRHPGAPVAFPLRWESLESAADAPPRPTVGDVLRDGPPEDDPWAGLDDARAELTKGAREQVTQALRYGRVSLGRRVAPTPVHASIGATRGLSTRPSRQTFFISSPQQQRGFSSPPPPCFAAWVTLISQAQSSLGQR